LEYAAELQGQQSLKINQSRLAGL